MAIKDIKKMASEFIEAGLMQYDLIGGTEPAHIEGYEKFIKLCNESNEGVEIYQDAVRTLYTIIALCNNNYSFTKEFDRLAFRDSCVLVYLINIELNYQQAQIELETMEKISNENEKFFKFVLNMFEQPVPLDHPMTKELDMALKDRDIRREELKEVQKKYLKAKGKAITHENSLHNQIKEGDIEKYLKEAIDMFLMTYANEYIKRTVYKKYNIKYLVKSKDISKAISTIRLYDDLNYLLELATKNKIIDMQEFNETSLGKTIHAYLYMSEHTEEIQSIFDTLTLSRHFTEEIKQWHTDMQITALIGLLTNETANLVSKCKKKAGWLNE